MEWLISTAEVSVGTGVLMAFIIAASTLVSHSARRVRIALVESLSTATARAEILRFPERSRRDLILLPARTAGPLDLAAALELYRSQPERPLARSGATGRTTMTSLGDYSRLSPETLRRAADMLRALQQAPEVRIGSLGRGRWEEFDLGR